MENCLFCRIIDKQIPVDILYEDEQVLVFNDINPQAPVHVLLIPKKHIETVLDLKEEDKELVGHLYLVANKIALNMKLNNGFRIVTNCREDAGQTVFHIHLHLLGGRHMHWPPG